MKYTLLAALLLLGCGQISNPTSFQAPDPVGLSASLGLFVASIGDLVLAGARDVLHPGLLEDASVLRKS